MIVQDFIAKNYGYIYYYIYIYIYMLQPDDCARLVPYCLVYETASSSQIDKLTSTISLSFIILLLLTINLTVV